MYDQIREDTLFVILYTVVTTMALMASCYLLFRRGFVVGGVYSVATLSYALIPMLYVYLLLLSVCIVIYMVRATRQYGRWLRDNYADLEHKAQHEEFGEP